MPVYWRPVWEDDWQQVVNELIDLDLWCHLDLFLSLVDVVANPIDLPDFALRVTAGGRGGELIVWLSVRGPTPPRSWAPFP